MDTRRQFQQEIIAFELYKKRFRSSLYHYGDQLSDWMKAGKILDEIELAYIYGEPDKRNKEYKKFLSNSYWEYLKELRELHERNNHESN